MRERWLKIPCFKVFRRYFSFPFSYPCGNVPKTHRKSQKRARKSPNGGVAAWAGATPDWAGLARPILPLARSWVAPAHAFLRIHY